MAADLPVTELVDSYYAEVQELGGNRWDTSSFADLARLEIKRKTTKDDNGSTHGDK